jgi:hypothetical protein
MMKLKYIRLSIKIALAAVIWSGCQSDYTKMVKEELGKGVRQDSILFGINFGDSRQDFYGRCFDLNKQQLVMQGPGNNSVQYTFRDSIVHKEPQEIRMLFFPNFDDNDRIAEMQMEFSYVGSAIYDKSLEADSLNLRLQDLLVAWYKGNEFVNAHLDEKDLPVKVDGNRRIILYNTDMHSVTVRVQDLLHPAFQHSITKQSQADSEKK